MRNNCDRQIKQNGRNLINLCRTFHMQIANGRFLGDLWGNFTHHNKNKGESTVDLAIISDTLFEYIEDFKVLPQKEFTDHCIFYSNYYFTMAKETVESDKYKWIQKEPGFKWNNNPMKFINALKSPGINVCY